MKNLFTKLARTTRTITTLAVVSFLITLLAGCDGLAGSPKTENTGCTVSGNLIISGDATAVRSATTSFDMENLALEFVEPLSVVANPQTQGISSCVATVEKTDSGYSYSVLLPAVGTWDLLVNFVLKKDDSTENVQVLHTTSEITIAEGVTSITKDIIIYPYMRADASGAIKLPITDATGLVSKAVCTAEWKNGPHTEEDLDSTKLSSTVNFTAGKAELVQTKVPTGNYEVTLEFLDSDDNTLYKCKEIIAVFSGFTTDTWSGTGAHLCKNAQGVTEFVISADVIGRFAGTSYALYNYNSQTSNYDETYVYYLKASADSSISASTNFASSMNHFAFDENNNFYFLTTVNGDVYLQSDRNTFTTSATGRSIGCEPHITIDRKNDVLWLFVEQEQSLYSFNNISAIDNLGTADNAYVSANYFYYSDEHTYSPVRFTAGVGMLYFAGFDSSSSPTKIYLTSTDVTSDVVNENGNIELKCRNTSEIDISSFGLSSAAELTDMLYQDNCVYLLVKEKRFEQNSGLETAFAMVSRGAVIRYNSVSHESDFCGWTDSNNGATIKVADAANNEKFYLSNGSEQLISRTYDKADWISVSAKTDLKLTNGFGSGNSYTVNIPAASSKSAAISNNAFYGPQKFVAIKPKKLVIADSGIAFYTDENNVWRYKNLNRVVTVDLEQFVIESGTASVYSGVFASKFTSNLIKFGGSGYGAMLSDDFTVSATLYDTNASFNNPSGSYWEITPTEAKTKIYAGLLRDDE